MIPPLPFLGPIMELEAEARRLRVLLAERLAARARSPRGAWPTEAVEAAERSLGEARELTRAAGLTTPLGRLAQEAQLSPFAREVLVAATLAELDGDIRRLVVELQGGDAGRPFLDLELATDLWADDLERRAAARDDLHPDAPLVRLRLLAVPDGFSKDDVSLLRMPLRPARRVVDFLAGRVALDAALAGAARRVPEPGREPRRHGPDRPLTADLVLGSAERARIDKQLSRWLHGVAPTGVLALVGPEGVGKSTLARSIAARLGRASLEIRVDALPTDPDAMARAFRESLLSEALLVLSGWEAVEPADQKRLLAAIDHELLPVIVEQRLPARLPLRRGLFVVPIDLPDHHTRVVLWSGALASNQLPSDDVDQLAVKYRVTAGTILSAASRVRGLDTTKTSVASAVEEALAEGRTHALTELARPIRSRPTWNDLVLPAGTKADLESMVSHFRHRKRVLLDWGLDRSLTTGAGLSALFEGPPGTGKTYAAGLIAREFDLELWQVDVSRIVSKWIGETEKNLSSIFDEAEKAHAIILFDEADSLFGKRTEQKSSNDRAANLEVNFLLQKLDAYPGIAILTSNLASSMDDAFARRLTFRIHFPAPDAASRALLWRTLLPKSAPLGPDVDFNALGAEFELSGGHIRNAVLRAAVLAAEADQPIGRAHLVSAARTEYRALGRLVRS
ncbi:MAG: ATP-binding protein [Deltaproteobacteria bacterium]|nr:ATP-binding protein [Deltaproteobacteria bacterium]